MTPLCDVVPDAGPASRRPPVASLSQSAWSAALRIVQNSSHLSSLTYSGIGAIPALARNRRQTRTREITTADV